MMQHPLSNADSVAGSFADSFDDAIAARIARANARARAAGLARSVRPYSGSRSIRLNLADNDYLGLAADESLRSAFLAQGGCRLRFSASASPMLMGTSPGHERLERALEKTYARRCLTLASGWHANTGLVGALGAEFGRSLLIAADRLAHASMIEGMRVAAGFGAQFVRFAHNDPASLERLLEKRAPGFEAVLVLTESVFSMDGDCGCVARIVALKQRFDNLLIAVDEAHAVGALGAGGSGLVCGTDLDAGVDFIVGTFGKALASAGAFIAVREPWCEFLANRMRPLIYSTAEPEIISAWTAWLWEQMPDFADRRAQLAANAARVRRALAALTASRAAGCSSAEPNPSTPASTTHIVPVVLGGNGFLMAAHARLLELGIATAAVRPPTVPQGTARLRLSIKSTLTEDDMALLIGALEEVLKGNK